MSLPVTKQFPAPDEVVHFEKGTFEVVRVGGMTIGRASYEPGWRWSEHVGRSTGSVMCEVEHVGMVVEGHAVAEMADGTLVDLTPGTVFYIPPGHDSWVIGEERYVSLHFMGADHYARTRNEHP